MPKKDRHRADGELFSLDIPSYRTLPAHCRRMATRDLIRSTKLAAFRKQRAGHTYGGNFTISRLHTNPPLQLKRWNASRGCMPSRKRPEDVRQTSGVRLATRAA